MKKTLFLTVTIIVFCGIFFLLYNSVTPQRKPWQNKSTIYQDKDYTVLVQDRNVLLKTKSLDKTRIISMPENKFSNATRIRNKAKDKPPLLDITVKDGLLMTGEKNVFIIDLNPEPKIIITYPNPKTKKSKIIINKNSNVLYFYKQGYLVKRYSIATGKKDSFTPEGNFEIVNKNLYPQGKNPNSLLGVRWMGLAVPDQKDKRANNDIRAPRGMKYGIHGTNEPESIGTHASGGCIRLKNEDVAELYAMVPLGTEVEIR